MGVLFSFLTPTYYRESFPPAPEWTPNNMPDLSGKVVIVTGGNSGIGREAVKCLLKKNAKVYIASRSEERIRRAINELRDETGREALSLQLDLSDLRSVRRAAQEFTSKEPKLDILINNG
ncbi:hypothetical protein EWM64_g2322 [Hericium alpestre]|uniref:Ketoreductase (KR) domain-containing protein n=1 Tax=Hericium alpestre TaxID=135208 RepID=A0A4Z0A626_9AGAM|nr:hypothetical protein EWM64_g2322 [Hericium alpestre]